MKYFSVVETAKLLRTALKEAFPTVKFKVNSKSYSGGASINVEYIDGPTYENVKAIADKFEGSYFCGMTDYKGNNYSAFNGEKCSFGADFVFVTRKLSVEGAQKILEATAEYWGFDPAQYEIQDSSFSAFVKNGWQIQLPNAGRNLEELFGEQKAKIGFVEPLPSPTADAVEFLGDDGYGYGCVGMKKDAA
jgi:hypothetical protein